MKNPRNRTSISLLFHEEISKLSLKERQLYYLAFFYWYSMTYYSSYIFLEKLFLNFNFFSLFSFRLKVFEVFLKTLHFFLFIFYFFIKKIILCVPFFYNNYLLKINFFIKLNKDFYFFFTICILNL